MNGYVLRSDLRYERFAEGRVCRLRREGKEEDIEREDDSREQRDGILLDPESRHLVCPQALHVLLRLIRKAL